MNRPSLQSICLHTKLVRINIIFFLKTWKIKIFLLAFFSASFFPTSFNTKTFIFLSPNFCILYFSSLNTVIQFQWQRKTFEKHCWHRSLRVVFFLVMPLPQGKETESTPLFVFKSVQKICTDNCNIMMRCF